MATFSDPFTGAAGDISGAGGWATIGASSHERDGSGNVRGDGSGQFAYTVQTGTALDTADHAVEFPVINLNGASFAELSLIARASTSGQNGYSLHYENFGSVDLTLYRIDSGSFTELDRATGLGTGNRAVRLEVEGTTIRGYFDGVEVVSATGQTNHSTNKNVGMEAFGTGPTATQLDAEDLSGGPITVVPGVLTETDAMQPVSRRKRRAPSFVAETDSLLAVGRRKRRTIAVASESDSLQPVARRKVRTVGVLVESDEAQPATARKTLAVGLLEETDEALTAGRIKSWSTGVLEEVDELIGPDVVVPIVGHPGTLLESDELLPVARRKVRTVGVLVESDEVPPAGRSKRRTVGLLSTTSAMLAATRVKRALVGLLTETSALLPAARTKLRAVGPLAETDEMLSVTDGSATVGHPGTLAETDELLPIARVKRRQVGVLIETTSMQPCTRRKQRSAGLLSETESILPAARRKTGYPGVLTTIDTTIGPSRSKSRSVGLLAETDVMVSMVPLVPLIITGAPRTIRDLTAVRTITDQTPARTITEVIT